VPELVKRSKLLLEKQSEKQPASTSV